MENIQKSIIYVIDKKMQDSPEANELNELLAKEQISQAKGSFHGRGLWERKQEKDVLQPRILALQEFIQLKLQF